MLAQSRIISCTRLLRNRELVPALDCWRNQELFSAHGVCSSVQRSCAVLAQSRVVGYFPHTECVVLYNRVRGSVQQSVWFCTTECVVLYNEVVQVCGFLQCGRSIPFTYFHFRSPSHRPLLHSAEGMSCQASSRYL